MTKIVWDAHGCFPLRINTDLSALQNYRQAGVDFVSINVGMDFTESDLVGQLLKQFAHWIQQNSQYYTVVGSISELKKAKKQGQLAIAFDLEGSQPLEGKLERLELFYELGVRQMLLAYNRNNDAAGGCLDNNMGLTAYGRSLVKKMNQLGILVDAAHGSERASLELMECSQTPIIFSHANCRALCPHPRNLTDLQIKMCAEQNGVIGINGLSFFLGGEKNLPELFVRHIVHVTELVGIDHVGIGLDYEDKPDHNGLVTNTVSKKYFYVPPDGKKEMPIFMPPQQLADVIELLKKRGFLPQDLDKLLGGNFMRVATQAWGQA